LGPTSPASAQKAVPITPVEKLEVKPSGGVKPRWVVLADNQTQLRSALEALTAARSVVEFSRALAETDVGFDLARQDMLRAFERAGGPRKIPGSPKSPGTQYADPLGSMDAGLTAKLRGQKPRRMLVGPGRLPTESDLARGSDGGARALGDPTTGAMPNPKEGFSTREGYELLLHYPNGTVVQTHVTTHSDGTVGYASKTVWDPSGRFSTWEQVEFHEDKEIHHRHSYVDDSNLIHESWTQTRGGSREVYFPQRDVVPREEYHPPLRAPRRDMARYQPIEDTGGGDGAAWCNPISGHCYEAGIRTSKTYVHPGRGESQPLVGPRLAIDPRSLVVNPNPVDPAAKSKVPKTIVREGMGPGPRPPK